MSMTSLAKAVIINLDKNGQSTQCLFNPNEYTFAKRNKWTEAKNAGQNMPQLEFSSGKPATLKMRLFFDTYAERTDVRNYTDQIWELAMVDENLIDSKTQKARPPMVRFQWGKTWSFDAVVTRLSQKFTLFLDDGLPVRAMLDTTFQQVRDSQKLRPQNPTTAGRGGERYWTVRSGETLAWVAYQVYNDSSKWRHIAEKNKLTQLRELVPGTILEIPNA